MRKASDALRRGDFRIIDTRDATKVFVFERKFEEEKIIVALNRGSQSARLGDYLKDMTLLYSTSKNPEDRALPALSAAVYRGKVISRNQ